MQQERDRLAATFAADQRAATIAQQTMEIRQLAILQAEIQSMQPVQPQHISSSQPQQQA
jgi:hypothetical protein